MVRFGANGMIEAQSMDCGIYVDSDKSIDEVVQIVADALNGTARARSGDVQSPLVEVDVRRNKDVDPAQSRNPSDGFLYFRYRIELYPRPELTLQDKVTLTSKLLERFWSLGLSAVAA